MPSIALKSEQRSVGLDIQEARTVHTRKIHSFGSKMSSDKDFFVFLHQSRNSVHKEQIPWDIN